MSLAGSDANFTEAKAQDQKLVREDAELPKLKEAAGQSGGKPTL
jgi:hypothetical protein